MSVATVRSVDLSIRAESIVLPGQLVVPSAVSGVVVFAHGSGSSRLSPRNQYVARVLHEAGLATVLFDLLSKREAEDRSLVFDIDLLGARLRAASRQILLHPATSELPVGLFGASTGAAAALMTAAREPHVKAVVSRGGRPDLAAEWLGRVLAPTLLIVGALDYEVLELNRHALAELRCAKQLATVPGATHLFEEPGTLERAANLAKDWFVEHLAKGGAG